MLWGNLLWIVFLLILQIGLFSSLKLFGVKPDLLLIFVVLEGLYRGTVRGAQVGLLAGFMQGIISGRFLGMFALAKAISGYFAGLLTMKFFRESIYIPLLAVWTATIVHELVVWAILRIFHPSGEAYGFVASLFNIILPTAVYNTLLTPVLYYIRYKKVNENLLIKED